jgi:hypothetical protein
MKKTTLLLMACGLAAGSAQAELLVHEEFRYTGSGVNHTLANGVGLIVGDWYAGPTGDSGSNANARFAPDSLSFAGHFSPAGGALEIGNDAGPNYGEAAASIEIVAPPSGATVLYSSCIMTMGLAEKYHENWTVEQRFNSSKTGNYSSAAARNVLSVYKSGNKAERKAAVSSNGSEVAQTAGTIQPGIKYLFVTKYTIIDANITAATLYVFDESAYARFLSAASSATADSLLGTHALFSLTDKDASPVDKLTYLQFTIIGGPKASYDDYRFGTEVADVVNLRPMATD